MALIVGITGGIGSGKTAATDLFAARGITIVDADLASRIIMEPGKPALDAVAKHFGDHLLLPDGTLDRAALRARVFANDDDRLWLESLTHPLIGKEISEQLAASDSAYTMLSSPLLLETGQHGSTDYTIVVDVPEAMQVARTMARDNNYEEQVRRIIAAQMSRQDRLARADRVIDNSGTLVELKEQVARIHEELLQRATAAEG
ncbi:MAG: dephospho-CoA kinase [Pseudomonadota bacterium]